jgi:hypothetical protein
VVQKTASLRQGTRSRSPTTVSATVIAALPIFPHYSFDLDTLLAGLEFG